VGIGDPEEKIATPHVVIAQSVRLEASQQVELALSNPVCRFLLCR